MLTADGAFANAANAAAMAFAATPPYVAYQLELRTGEGTAEKDESARIVVRTRDGAAIVDAGTGVHQQPAPPALPPTVDALANWAFALESANGYPVMHVDYQQPRHYDFATPGPNVDVVVPGINGFSVRYAADDATHLQLEPATAAFKALATQRDRFLYSDVWFDPATWLPTRVVVVAVNATLTLDYANISGRWLLSHVAYTDVAQSPSDLHHTTIDATYTNYTFPVTDDGFR
jgi:hypothetical protein